MSSQTQRPHRAGLVAVLLITASRPGPKLVFHYPVEPDYSHPEALFANGSVDSDQDTDNEDGSPPPVNIEQYPTGATPPLPDNLKSKGRPNSTVESVLGQPVEGLEKLLSPGRWCNGKKFEIRLNDLVFVGHPIFANEDGEWSENRDETSIDLNLGEKTGPTHGDVAVAGPQPNGHTAHDFTHVPESLDSQAGFVANASSASNSSISGLLNEQVTMFHVVFALRPSRAGQQHIQVSAVYHDIAETLSKALNYCQEKSKYVTIESQKLLSHKAKDKQHGTSSSLSLADPTESSELAWALKELFQQISTDGIANIRLCGFEIALHISSDRLQESANPSDLGPLSALLLLESKESILRELSHPEASPLARFLREHTPNKSLHKHANKLALPLADVLYLAHHLIEWRKARAITPLHQRNTYVVNPSAPLHQLNSHIENYSRAFPSLPPLANVLKVLSGKPIQYGLLIPSRDHRGPYMELLAFLVRHELVVQLKTAAWLCIPRALAYEPSPVLESKSRLQPSSADGFNLLSPHLRPVQDDDNISVVSDRTAIPLSRDKRFSTFLKPDIPDIAGSVTDVTDFDSVFVTNPSAPSDEEAVLIARLIEQSGFREILKAIVPHLDGQHALEEIAAREGLKRSHVEECLADLDSKGFLTTTRYQ